jgi:CHAT domain-containing protein
MELFYARLARGEPEDQALWMAQKDLRADVGATAGPDRGIALSRTEGASPSRTKGSARFDDPFYWSPFVLISAH